MRRLAAAFPRCTVVQRLTPKGYDNRARGNAPGVQPMMSFSPNGARNLEEPSSIPKQFSPHDDPLLIAPRWGLCERWHANPGRCPGL